MGKKLNYIFILIASALIYSCTENQKSTEDKPVETFKFFGDSMNADGYIFANEALAKLASNDSIQLKIKGKVNEVCQKKGCWMTIALNDTTEMRVRFKDYGFFMPKDIANDTVIFEGWMYRDSVSVEQLKHYEKDAGSSQATIDSITKPELNYLFEANGVLLKK